MRDNEIPSAYIRVVIAGFSREPRTRIPQKQRAWRRTRNTVSFGSVYEHHDEHEM
jgi:hypothetical protein